MERDLGERGFQPETTEAVIADLKERGLLDDRDLAAGIVAAGQNRGRGRAKVYADLRRRGIERDLAEESLQAFFAAELEEMSARRFIAENLTPEASAPGDARFDRLLGRMSRRGFSSSAIKKAVDGFRREDEEKAPGFLDTY